MTTPPKGKPDEVQDDSRRKLALALLGGVAGALMLEGCDDDANNAAASDFEPEIRGTAQELTVTVTTVAALAATTGGAANDLAHVLGYYSAGDGGGGLFYWDATSTATQNGGTIVGSNVSGRWRRLYSGALNVKWFGAKGDADQTLFATNYVSDITHTQGTRDQLAINSAIRVVRAAGSGSIYIPAGVYCTYGYLEQIDCAPGATATNNISIFGDGPGVSIIRSCSTSPCLIGYGIMRIGDAANIPASVTRVHLRDFTLDGNGYNRSPAGEPRADCLTFNGFPNATVTRVDCINSVRDCVLVNFQADNGVYAPPSIGRHSDTGIKFTDCNFSDSWRNTLTIASGSHLKFVDCRIARGGKVANGTNPRACIDIEPDIATSPVTDLVFTNCSIEDGNNQLVSQVWSEARWEACTFNIKSPDNTYRWAWMGTASHVDFVGCSFNDTTNYQGYVWAMTSNGIYATGRYAKSQYISLQGCSFNGVGYFGQSKSHHLQGNKFLNSRFPVLFEQSIARVENIVVRECSLVNVVDTNNYSSGTVAAFSVKLTVTPTYVEVDGLDVKFDPTAVPAGVSFASTLSIAHGVSIAPTLSSISACKVSNVNVSGYWRKYPALYGYTPSGLFSDWGNTSGGAGAAPADSTGTIAGPGVTYYRNCTEYGNSP